MTSVQDAVAQVAGARHIARHPLSPFRPARGGQPPLLAGRTDVLDRFSARIAARRGANCLVVGGQVGVGKSALLSRFRVVASAAGWRVVEHGLASSTGAELVAGIAEAVRQAGHTGREHRWLLLCDDVWPSRTGVPNAEVSWQPALAAFEAARRAGLRLELVLVGGPGLAAAVPIPHDVERLDLLEASACGQAVAGPLAGAGMPALPASAPAIIARTTAGLPYAVQVFGDVLWEHGVASSAPYSHLDLLGLRRVVLDRVDLSFFELPFDALMPVEQDLLQAMAEASDGGIDLAKIDALMIGRDDAMWTVASLVDQAWLHVDEGRRVAFAMPLLGDYLRRRVRFRSHAVRDLAMVREAAE